MDNIQLDMLQALNEFTVNVQNSILREDGHEYNEEHSTWLWTLQQLKEELLTTNAPPLVTIERFQRRLKGYSYSNELFAPCEEIIDRFLCTVL